jgi:putative ABC transport system substrate-binding protein
MKRREFLLGAGAMAWPCAARSQQRDAVRRVGVLLAAYTQTDPAGQARITALRASLQAMGWSDNRNLRIDYRWGEGNIDRIRALASELVQSAPDVIVVAGDPALTQVHRLRSAIPIVFAQVSEPVESGFVASLARPGGSITGFQNFEPEMGGKWLSLLKEAAPSVRRVGALHSADAAPHASFLRAAQAAAPLLGAAVTIIDVQNSGNIEHAITAFGSQPDTGLIVFPHPNTIANRRSINALAIRLRIPAIYPYRYFAADGGLVSYGPDQIDQWHGVARYLDRILKGEKAGELPVQAPTKFQLVINLSTAKALGLALPPQLLARTDEVIE